MRRRCFFKNYEGSPSNGEVLPCDGEVLPYDGGTSSEIMRYFHPTERYFHAMERLFRDLAEYLRLLKIALDNLYRVQNPIKVCKLQRPPDFKPQDMPKESRFVGGEIEEKTLSLYL